MKHRTFAIVSREIFNAHNGCDLQPHICFEFIDIRFIGFACKTKNIDKFKTNMWLKVTAVVQMCIRDRLKTISEFYTNKFQEVCFKAAEGDYDVLFLDEILHVIRKDLLSETIVLDFLKHKPEKLEVIMTGYDPSPALLEMADYVTHMVKEKHPYDKGIPARVGIEC